MYWVAACASPAKIQLFKGFWPSRQPSKSSDVTCSIDISCAHKGVPYYGPSVGDRVLHIKTMMLLFLRLYLLLGLSTMLSMLSNVGKMARSYMHLFNCKQTGGRSALSSRLSFAEALSEKRWERWQTGQKQREKKITHRKNVLLNEKVRCGKIMSTPLTLFLLCSLVWSVIFWL